MAEPAWASQKSNRDREDRALGLDGDRATASARSLRKLQ